MEIFKKGIKYLEIAPIYITSKANALFAERHDSFWGCVRIVKAGHGKILTNVRKEATLISRRKKLCQ